MKSLGENVGIYDKQSFVNLFLRPKETAEKAFLTIMNNLAVKQQKKSNFRHHECGTADGSYISNMIAA